MKEKIISINGIKLNVVEAGPSTGPLMIMLHGFPEFWYGWRHQIDYFSQLGYHVIVPDQRGCGLSERPEKISDYNVEPLAKDVLGLIEHFGKKKTILVGHDWGAIVAWWTAIRYPEKIQKLVTLNVPHPFVFNRFVQEHWGQRLRSWYMLFFQLPIIPEFLFKFVGKWSLVFSSRRGTFSSTDLKRYTEIWNQPGALTGMINWYRTLTRSPAPKLESYEVKVPTLILWGKKDAFLMHEMAEESLKFCPKAELKYLNASHWVQHEAAQEVNQLIQDFIS